MNGVRIELAEIEAALAATPGVARAAAVAWKDQRTGNYRIAGYVVPEPSRGDEVAHEARDVCLVPAMVPTVVLPLEDIRLVSGRWAGMVVRATCIRFHKMGLHAWLGARTHRLQSSAPVLCATISLAADLNPPPAAAQRQGRPQVAAGARLERHCRRPHLHRARRRAGVGSGPHLEGRAGRRGGAGHRVRLPLECSAGWAGGEERLGGRATGCKGLQPARLTLVGFSAPFPLNPALTHLLSPTLAPQPPAAPATTFSSWAATRCWRAASTRTCARSWALTSPVSAGLFVLLRFAASAVSMSLAAAAACRDAADRCAWLL